MVNQKSCLVCGFVVFALSHAGHAAAYHIAGNGDDARTALEAGHPSTPWRSFKNLETLALAPGDSILLRRGDTLRGGLRVLKSGTETKPIFVGPYGAGNPPLIFGTEVILDWKPGRSGKWQGRIKSKGAVGGVFQGGRPITASRFPKEGWIPADHLEGDSVLVAKALAKSDWTGATVFVRTNAWTLEKHQVVRQNGARLSIDHLQNKAPDQVRFFLTNVKPEAMEPRTWSISDSDRVLAIAQGQDGGPPKNVDVSVVENGIDLGSHDWIKIDGIGVEGTTEHGIVGSGKGVEVNSCQIQLAGRYGINLNGPYALVKNCRVLRSTSEGILVFGKHALVEDNTVIGTSQLQSLGIQKMGKGCGIRVEGDSGRILSNHVDSVGYSGIFFTGVGCLVERNLVEHFCMTTDDGGGINTWVGNYDSIGSLGSIIRFNVVRNGMGAPDGWPRATEETPGIYLDDGSHDILVESNVVSGNTFGVFLHNNRRNRVRRNILYANRLGPVLLSHDNTAGAGDAFENTIDSNYLVALLGQNAEIGQNLARPQARPQMTESGNIVCSDFGASIRCRRDGVELLDKEWDLSKYVGPNAELLGGAGAGNGKPDWKSTAGVRVDKESSLPNGGERAWKIGIDPDSSRSKQGKLYALLANSTFRAKKGEALWLRFQARAPKHGQILAIKMRRSSRDFGKVGKDLELALDTTWKTFSILLEMDSDDPNVQLGFYSKTSDPSWWMADPTMRAVPTEIASRRDGIVLLSNPGATPLPLDAGVGPWSDAWGRSETARQNLDAFAGKVLFRTTSPF